MPHADLLADLVYDGDWRGYDLSYGMIARLVDHLRGGYVGGPDTVIRSPGNVQRLPYEFSREDYEQILHDVRSLVARELGWQPSSGSPANGRTHQAS